MLFLINFFLIESILKCANLLCHKLIFSSVLSEMLFNCFTVLSNCSLKVILLFEVHNLNVFELLLLILMILSPAWLYIIAEGLLYELLNSIL